MAALKLHTGDVARSTGIARMEVTASSERVGVTQCGVTRLLRVNEVCKLLGLSRTKVYELMETGELVYCRFGTARRVPLAAVQALIDRATVGRQGADE